MNFYERINNYNQTFSKYSPIYYDGRWISGTWIIGNYYKRKHNYHGEYPPSYLKRIYSLFPDKKQLLHLFSGKVDKEDANSGVRFDIKNLEGFTDVIGDVRNINNIFKPNSFDLVLADPPYTTNDFAIYGATPFSKAAVLKNLYDIVIPGGFVVWLDIRVPIFNKERFNWVGNIELITGTNRIIRTTTIFQRVE